MESGQLTVIKVSKFLS